MDDDNIVMGKSDYYLNWYHKRCKTNDVLQKKKNQRQMKYYYDNQALILFKKRELYAKEKGEVRKYTKKTPLKSYQAPERKQWRQRKGHIEPILHDYPKQRQRVSKIYSDGVVV